MRADETNDVSNGSQEIAEAAEERKPLLASENREASVAKTLRRLLEPEGTFNPLVIRGAISKLGSNQLDDPLPEFQLVADMLRMKRGHLGFLSQTHLVNKAVQLTENAPSPFKPDEKWKVLKEFFTAMLEWLAENHIEEVSFSRMDQFLRFAHHYTSRSMMGDEALDKNLFCRAAYCQGLLYWLDDSYTEDQATTKRFVMELWFACTTVSVGGRISIAHRLITVDHSRKSGNISWLLATLEKLTGNSAWFYATTHFEKADAEIMRLCE